MDYDMFIKDLLGFIAWAQEEGSLSNAQILGNIGHDLAGIVYKKECFSPRTEGYWLLYQTQRMKSKQS